MKYWVLNGKIVFTIKGNDRIIKSPGGEFLKVDETAFNFLQWLTKARDEEEVRSFLRKFVSDEEINLFLQLLSDQKIIIQSDNGENHGELIEYRPEPANFSYVPGLLILLAGIVGAFVFFSKLKEGVLFSGIERFTEVKDYLLTIFLLIVASLLHELGHIVSFRFFTSRFPDIGVGFSGIMSIIPSIKTRITETHILPKIPAILIVLSGILMDFVTLGILSIVFESTRQPYILFTIFALSFGIILNVIPFWVSDGYYLLEILFNKNNLIEDSLVELRKFLKTGKGKPFEILFGIAYLTFKWGFPIFIIYLSYKLWGIIALKISLFIFFVIFFYHFTINFVKHMKPNRRSFK